VGGHLIADIDIGTYRAEPAPQSGGGINLGRGSQSRSLQQLAGQLQGSTAPGDLGCPFELAGDRLIRGDDRPRAVTGTLDRVFQTVCEDAVRTPAFGWRGGVVDGPGLAAPT
jgi:hypothetical protein